MTETHISTKIDQIMYFIKKPSYLNCWPWPCIISGLGLGFGGLGLDIPGPVNIPGGCHSLQVYENSEQIRTSGLRTSLHSSVVAFRWLVNTEETVVRHRQHYVILVFVHCQLSTKIRSRIFHHCSSVLHFPVLHFSARYFHFSVPAE